MGAQKYQTALFQHVRVEHFPCLRVHSKRLRDFDTKSPISKTLKERIYVPLISIWFLYPPGIPPVDAGLLTIALFVSVFLFNLWVIIILIAVSVWAQQFYAFALLNF